uniref:Sushi domain-containing protein n=1 Tax=Panagrolaimus sp. ES5 TaxID=591445 RepID=A0AC34F3U6_9BILA
MNSYSVFLIFVLYLCQVEAGHFRFKRQVGVVPVGGVGVVGGAQVGGINPYPYGNGAGVGVGGVGLQVGGVNALNNNGPQCLGGPLTPLNGQLQYSTGSILGPWPAGSIATLTCNAGFMPRGVTQSICQNGIFNAVGECIPGNNGGIGGVAPLGNIPVGK